MANMEDSSMSQDSSDEVLDYNEEWLYCLRGNILDEAVEMLKERLVTDLAIVDQNGNGALHYCCANNLAEAVVFLLKECKLDYCRVNSNGNTPLQWAVQTNSMEAAKQVLLHDYNVHRAEYEAVSRSEYYNALECTSIRDEFKLDDDTKKYYNIVEYNRGYAVNNKINLMSKNAFGKSILNDAFNAKDQEILHAILEHPAAAVLDEQNQAELPVERVVVNGVNGVIHAFHFSSGDGDANPHPEVKARELEIKDEEILNSTCAELDRSGEVIWETDLVAAQWLTALAKDGKFNGKKALQLGSGCGLSGMAMYVAARFYGKVPSRLTFTDVSKETLINLKYNLEINQLHEHDGTVIHALDWTKEETWPRNPEGMFETFDVIIGSDLVYEENLVMPLTNVINMLLDRQCGELFYVFKEERQGSNLVPEALQKLGFDVQMQQAPRQYLVNPLTSKDERVVEFFFPELKTEGFTMLHARRR